MNNNKMKQETKINREVGGSKPKSRLGKLFWVWAVVAGVVVILRCFTGGEPPEKDPNTLGGRRIESNPIRPPVPSEDSVEAQRRKREAERQLTSEKEKLHAEIAAREVKYRKDVQEIAERYRKMLPLERAEKYFKQAEQGAGFIASSDGLCGFKACGTLAYKMAYDMVKKTHFAEEAISRVVDARVNAPIKEAVKIYEKWTVELRQELQREEMAFAQDLAVKCQKFKETVSCIHEIDVIKVNRAVEEFEKTVKAHARESVLGVVGAVVDVALVKSSSEVIKSVAKKLMTFALRGVAKKLMTTASVSVASAVSDGPLPIGDVVGGCITVVGLGWTAYDLYRVTKTMPREMRTRLVAAINATRKSLLKTAMENLNSDRDMCLDSAQARVEELHKVINK